MVKFVALLAAMAGVILVTSAHATVVADGDFSTWTFDSSGTGSATVTRETSGGNPDARLNVTTVTLSATAFGTGIKSDFSTNAALDGGSFTLSLDVLSGSGDFGQGQFIDLLVEQNGSVYATPLGVTGFPHSSFATITFNGTFNEGSFVKVIGSGPNTPSFNGSATTRFGFAAGNTNSGTLTQYYDNFLLDFATASPAPALSNSSLIVLAGLLTAGGMLWQKRRNTSAARLR